MAASKSKIHYTEEDVLAFERALKFLVTDKAYNTRSTYSANSSLYPDHLIPFFNKHMDYLRNHPTVDPTQYIANLKLMTKIR